MSNVGRTVDLKHGTPPPVPRRHWVALHNLTIRGDADARGRLIVGRVHAGGMPRDTSLISNLIISNVWATRGILFIWEGDPIVGQVEFLLIDESDGLAKGKQVYSLGRVRNTQVALNVSPIVRDTFEFTPEGTYRVLIRQTGKENVCIARFNGEGEMLPLDAPAPERLAAPAAVVKETIKLPTSTVSGFRRERDTLFFEWQGDEIPNETTFSLYDSQKRKVGERQFPLSWVLPGTIVDILLEFQEELGGCIPAGANCTIRVESGGKIFEIPIIIPAEKLAVSDARSAAGRLSPLPSDEPTDPEPLPLPKPTPLPPEAPKASRAIRARTNRRAKRPVPPPRPISTFHFAPASSVPAPRVVPVGERIDAPEKPVIIHRNSDGTVTIESLCDVEIDVSVNYPTGRFGVKNVVPPRGSLTIKDLIAGGKHSIKIDSDYFKKTRRARLFNFMAPEKRV